MKKTFQVVRRGRQWHVHMPDSNRGVSGSEDKARIIAWACAEAQRVRGEVRVLDRAGQLEALYSYVDGIEVRTEPNPPRYAG